VARRALLALLWRRPRLSSKHLPQRWRDGPRSNAAPLAVASLARQLALANPTAATFATPPCPSHANFTNTVPLEAQPEVCPAFSIFIIFFIFFGNDIHNVNAIYILLDVDSSYTVPSKFSETLSGMN
jgi:hypothetical protein